MSDLERCQKLTGGYLDVKLQRNFKLKRYWVLLFFFKKKSFSFTPLLHGGVHNAQNTTLAQPRTEVCLALSKKQIRAVH